jgi:tyrosinase
VVGKAEFRESLSSANVLKSSAHLLRINRYWRISTDAENILASPIWDTTTGLGGNGLNGNGCIQDGPFVNTTLRFHEDATAGEVYCISRNINVETYKGSAQGEIDQCMQSPNFEAAHGCYENTVHASAHQGTGGVVGRSTRSVLRCKISC